MMRPKAGEDYTTKESDKGTESEDKIRNLPLDK